MTSFRKIASAIACTAAIGGGAIGWHSYTGIANQQKLVAIANSVRAQAQQGDARAQLQLGHIYYRGEGLSQDYAKAFTWYSKAGDQGDAKAQYAICYMYHQGKGVPPNNIEALHWCEKAAEQDDKKAQYVIGMMYYNGDGVHRDYAEAFHWYHKAADQGYAKAQYGLGYMYWYGLGTVQDRAEANRWFRKAAEQGDARAQQMFTTPFNTRSKIFLFIKVLGAILLLAHSFIRVEFNLRQPSTLAGLIILLEVAVDMFARAHFEILPSASVVNFFDLFKNLLAGIVIALLISVIWPWARSAKFFLGISGLSFVGFNSCVVVRYQLRYFHAFYIINGLLIGISVPLAVFLWSAYKKSKDSAATARH